MAQRIYWSDIVECEDQLFESVDVLIAVATETPECFLGTWHWDNEIVSVDTNDEMELVITYNTLDEYDDDGNEVRKEETETFSYNYAKQLAVLVG